jgi:hypothetical protein
VRRGGNAEQHLRPRRHAERRAADDQTEPDAADPPTRLRALVDDRVAARAERDEQIRGGLEQPSGRGDRPRDRLAAARRQVQLRRLDDAPGERDVAEHHSARRRLGGAHVHERPVGREVERRPVGDGEHLPGRRHDLGIDAAAERSRRERDGERHGSNDDRRAMHHGRVEHQLL